MAKRTNTIRFLILGLSIMLLIHFVYSILTNKWNEVPFLGKVRDFFFIAVLFTPPWFLINPIIRFLDKKKILSTSFLLRFLRSVAIAFLLSIPVFILMYVIRATLYHPDDDPASQKITIMFLINFVLVQILEYYHFFIKEKEDIIRTVREEKEIIKIKHDILKEQVNPHFLFNSLNVLSSLIYVDQDKANQYTKELSKLYRYILNANHYPKIEIEKELKFIRSYFYILHLRFGNAINLEIDGATSLKGYIVPLTLQLLVENAQKHNSFSEKSPLNISIVINADSINVTNNLAPKYVEESDGIGIRYINTLYNNYENHPEIQIHQSETQYSVIIPIIK